MFFFWAFKSTQRKRSCERSLLAIVAARCHTSPTFVAHFLSQLTVGTWFILYSLAFSLRLAMLLAMFTPCAVLLLAHDGEYEAMVLKRKGPEVRNELRVTQTLLKVFDLWSENWRVHVCTELQKKTMCLKIWNHKNEQYAIIFLKNILFLLLKEQPNKSNLFYIL